MLKRLLLSFALLLAACATPQPSATTAASGGMVSAADRRAAEAGVEILREGGTAADAAFATMIALTVVEPQSSGIGGGGFLVYHDQRRHPVHLVEGRESRTAAARPARAPLLFLAPGRGGGPRPLGGGDSGRPQRRRARQYPAGRARAPAP